VQNLDDGLFAVDDHSEPTRSGAFRLDAVPGEIFKDDCAEEAPWARGERVRGSGDAVEFRGCGQDQSLPRDGLCGRRFREAVLLEEAGRCLARLERVMGCDALEEREVG